ncbi:Helicase associated domain protein [Streptomyces formicae]
MPTRPSRHEQPRRLGSRILPPRDHQPDLLRKVVAELTPQPEAGIPEQGLRVTLAAAPGSGKTWISLEAARQLAPRRRVLVMVPTIDLLIQTVAWWRDAGHTEPAIAVCSKGHAQLRELGVRCTTSAPRLALWGGSGPATVFATYASLECGLQDGETVPGPLEQAMAGLFGQRLDVFDLVVVDEAHRTSGELGKPWAVVHDNARIRADRRLYMTATPRLWEVPGGEEGKAEASSKEGLGGQLVASMDDEEIYGRQVVFGLLEAIERGVLARFEIDVLEIRDPDAQEVLTGQRAQERRLAALQAALLAHRKESGLRSVITFHHRTRDAMGFARGVSSVASDLYESDPGHYPDPAKIAAEWLSAEHSMGHRRLVAEQFADGVDDDGVETLMSFLSVCRLLGEGADLTGKRGVDGVAFADTRGSVVDVVQNIGRALRQRPGEGKVARILVPVFLASDEDPRDMLSSLSYRPLVAILQALRAHDEQIVEKLVLRQDHSGRGVADEVLVDDPQYVRDAGAGEEQGKAVENGEAPVQGEGLPQSAVLRFFAPRDALAVTRFLRTRVLQPQSEVWLTGYNLLCRWVAEHGHARMPVQKRVPHAPGKQGAAGQEWDEFGQELTYPLGQWCAEQRRAHRDGVMRAWRFQLLDELGLEWDGSDARFAAKLALFRRYCEEHGTLAAPLAAVFEGQPIGQDLSNLRKPNGLGKKPERARRRREQLETIDPYWNPEWPLVWQRHWAKVKWCLTGGAQLCHLSPGLMVGGDDIGSWLLEQRRSWQGLSSGQRARLAEIGMQVPVAELEAADRPALDAAGSVALPAQATTWERGIAAIRQYASREGHVRVPRAHRETILIDHGDEGLREEYVRLGVWRSNTRNRRDCLTDGQRQEAERLGVLS